MPAGRKVTFGATEDAEVHAARTRAGGVKRAGPQRDERGRFLPRSGGAGNGIDPHCPVHGVAARVGGARAHGVRLGRGAVQGGGVGRSVQVMNSSTKPVWVRVAVVHAILACFNGCVDKFVSFGSDPLKVNPSAPNDPLYTRVTYEYGLENARPNNETRLYVRDTMDELNDISDTLNMRTERIRTGLSTFDAAKIKNAGGRAGGLCPTCRRRAQAARRPSAPRLGGAARRAQPAGLVRPPARAAGRRTERPKPAPKPRAAGAARRAPAKPRTGGKKTKKATKRKSKAKSASYSY